MIATVKDRIVSAPSMHKDFVDLLIDDWRREIPELDVDAMAVVGRILRLSNLLYRRTNELFRDFDLTYSEFDILATIRRSGSALSMKPSELANAVLLTSGAITAALDRLEAKGLVAREYDENDRRSLRATLTARGRKLAEKLAALRFEDASDTIVCLTEREMAVTANALRKVAHVLEQES